MSKFHKLMNILNWKGATLDIKMILLHTTGISQIFYGSFLFSDEFKFATKYQKNEFRKIYT